MNEHRVVAWTCGKFLHPHPCWHAKCSCGIVTAFDFTKEDAEAVIESEHARSSSLSVLQGLQKDAPK